MPVLTIRHVTTYRYKQPVAFGEHRMMLRPREGHDQRLLAERLDITPPPSELYWVHDVFGNSVAIARFSGRARELRFDSMVRLEHYPLHALDFRLDEQARIYPFSYGSEEIPDLARSIERLYPDPDRVTDQWTRRFLRKDGPTQTLDLLTEMTHAIKREHVYIPRHDGGIQDPARTLTLGSGTCRDFAVLMIEAARALGLAARFVSGYLYVPSRDNGTHVVADSGTRVVSGTETRVVSGAETRVVSDNGTHVGGGSTHAWARIYLPGAGWVEFDPTNGIVGNRDLVRVAVVRDARQAVPLGGTWFGFPADNLGMTVEVSVTADPRHPREE